MRFQLAAAAQELDMQPVKIVANPQVAMNNSQHAIRERKTWGRTNGMSTPEDWCRGWQPCLISALLDLDEAPLY